MTPQICKEAQFSGGPPPRQTRQTSVATTRPPPAPLTARGPSTLQPPRRSLPSPLRPAGPSPPPSPRTRRAAPSPHAVHPRARRREDRPHGSPPSTLSLLTPPRRGAPVGSDCTRGGGSLPALPAPTHPPLPRARRSPTPHKTHSPPRQPGWLAACPRVAAPAPTARATHRRVGAGPWVPRRGEQPPRRAADGYKEGTPAMGRMVQRDRGHPIKRAKEPCG